MGRACKMKFKHLPFSLLSLFLLTIPIFFKFYESAPSRAPNAISDTPNWDRAADSSHHSFHQLGEEFYVPLKMKSLTQEEARLVLFNHAAAKALGLELPDDPAELERIIIERFAKIIAMDGENFDQEMFATYYQDGEKIIGGALGDGRAAWAGELVVLNKDGGIQYIDFVLKGIGQTPLAWFNHTDPGHKDGWQSMEEAVHSFEMSAINFKNQLDTTVDIAVIEIPTTKVDKYTREKLNCAITIRAGGQMRMAHLRYYANDPKKFEEIFSYIIKRDLGLPQEQTVTEVEFENYMHKLITNISEEAARYYDLHAVHASPTAGNRTTLGSTIDLATFRYLDAHHKEYPYMSKMLKLGGRYGQVEQMKNYISNLTEFMGTANYQFYNKENKSKYLALFDANLKKHITNLWLTRLGLSSEEISHLSIKAKNNFMIAMKALYELEGESDDKINFGMKRFVPAILDVRQILGKSIEAFSFEKEEREKKITEIFTNNRPWAPPTPPSDFPDELDRYVNSVQAVIDELGGSVNPDWITKAQHITLNVRPPSDTAFADTYERPVIDLIKEKKSFTEITSEAYAGVDSLVDRGLPTREINNLGTRSKTAFFFSSFDRPLPDQIDLIQKIKTAYNLDEILIITNWREGAEQKSSLLKKQQAEIKKAINTLQGVFLAEDGIITALKRRTQTEEFFQIVEENSFEQFSQLAKKNGEILADSSGIIVVSNKKNVSIPRIFKNSVVELFEHDTKAHPAGIDVGEERPHSAIKLSCNKAMANLLQ